MLATRQDFFAHEKSFVKKMRSMLSMSGEKTRENIFWQMKKDLRATRKRINFNAVCFSYSTCL